MTTLIEEEDDENKDIIFPLLKTTTPISNGITINESSLIDKSVTISFSNINYIIGNEKIKKKQFFQCQMELFPFWKSIQSKQILNNISGIFPPGMNAILGRLFISFSIQFSNLFF